MLRYRLHTLLILLAVGPPILAVLWFFRIGVIATVTFMVAVVLAGVVALTVGWWVERQGQILITASARW